MKNINKNDPFYFEVEKVKSSDLFPGFAFNSYNSHSIVVKTPDNPNGVVVNNCSADYGLLPNRDIFPILEESLASEFKFVATRNVSDLSKFYVEYKLQGKEFSISPKTGKRDIISPVLRIQHSYNSRILFDVMFGFYREICTNGLWGYQYASEFVLSHTKNNVDKIVEKTMNATVKFMEEANFVRDKYQFLANGEIVTNLEERVDEIIENTNFHQLREDILERIRKEHQVDGLPITDYLIYNGFNFQLNHNTKIKMQPEHKVKLDRKVFSFITESRELVAL